VKRVLTNLHSIYKKNTHTNNYYYKNETNKAIHHMVGTKNTWLLYLSVFGCFGGCVCWLEATFYRCCWLTAIEHLLVH